MICISSFQSSSDGSYFEQYSPWQQSPELQGSIARLAHVMIVMMGVQPLDYASSLGGEGMAAVAATSVGVSEVSRFTSATSSFVGLSSAGSFRLAFSSASARQSSRIEVRTFGASNFLLLPRGAGSSGVRQ
jgi:hypothetical protein